MSTSPYPNAQAVFYQQYELARRDEVVGVLLALFLGTFGLHHFYLRRTGLGILYCCFFWTGIPSLLGFLECFLCRAVCASTTLCRQRRSQPRLGSRCRCGTRQ